MDKQQVIEKLAKLLRTDINTYCPEGVKCKQSLPDIDCATCHTQAFFKENPDLVLIDRHPKGSGSVKRIKGHASDRYYYPIIRIQEA